ncbi:hypothetical protein RCL1_007167 [Eukaryota sp. TZLM3-RCL]
MSSTLSPLVILNITDHFTRTCALSLPSSVPGRSRGVLLGKFDGSTVHITTSFSEAKDSTAPDAKDFLITRYNQYLELFKQDYFVGCYSCGYDTPNLETEVEFVKSIWSHFVFKNVENVSGQCVLLILNPLTRSLEESLFDLYDLAPSCPLLMSVEVRTSEAERVSLEQLQRDGQFEDGSKTVGSQLNHFTQRLTPTLDSLKVLSHELSKVKEYVDDVIHGKREYNSQILSSIYSLYSLSCNKEEVLGGGSLPLSSVGLTLAINAVLRAQSLVVRSEIPELRGKDPRRM